VIVPVSPPFFFLYCYPDPPHLHSFPTRRSSDLFSHNARWPSGSTMVVIPAPRNASATSSVCGVGGPFNAEMVTRWPRVRWPITRSEEHTSELQSRSDLVCRLLLEKKKQT